MTARQRKSQAKRRRHSHGPHRIANPELAWPVEAAPAPPVFVLTQWEVVILACIIGSMLLGVAIWQGWL